MNFHALFLFQRADGWWDWGGALGHSLTASESEWPPSGSFVADSNFRTFVLIATRLFRNLDYLGSLSMVEHTDKEYWERLEVHTRLLSRVTQPISWLLLVWKFPTYGIYYFSLKSLHFSSFEFTIQSVPDVYTKKRNKRWAQISRQKNSTKRHYSLFLFTVFWSVQICYRHCLRFVNSVLCWPSGLTSPTEGRKC